MIIDHCIGKSFFGSIKHMERFTRRMLKGISLNLPPLTYSQVNNEMTALNLVMAMFREVHFHTGQIIYAAKIRKGQLVWNYD